MLPQITILSEIWIEDEEILFYLLPGYNSYPKCNADHRAGGVIVFVANYLSCRRIGSIQITTADYVHLEIVFCKAFSVDIIGMYRLQEYSEIIFTYDLIRLLNTVKNRNFVGSGDVNINLLRHSEGVDYYNITMASNAFEVSNQ